MATTEYAIAHRTDTTQEIVDRPDTLEQLRTDLAAERANNTDPTVRVVGLIRRPPGAPMWQDIEP